MTNVKSFKHIVFSNFIWKFGERFLAQLVSLIISIILARLLTPEDFGVVAIVMIFITFANVFVSHGLGNALVQKQQVDNLDYSSVLYINIVIGIIVYVCLYIISPIIANFYSIPTLCKLLRVLGFRIIIASINSIQQAYVAKHLLFKRFFYSTLIGSISSAVVGIVLAYMGYGVWALIIQYLSNTIISTVVLWLTINWRPEFIFSFERVKKMFAFGWKLLVSGLLDTGYKQLSSVFIGKRYTSADLAFYSQGDKYPGLIVTNINASISGVLFPALSNVQDDINKVKLMTRKALQVSSFIILPCMFGIAAIAKPLISILLTDKWLPCVPFLQLFCISYGLWPIHTANLQAIKAIGRSDIFLKLEIIKKIIGIFALIISVKISPLAMAISIVITDFIAIFINAYPNRKLLGYGYIEQAKDILPTFIISFIMSIIIYPVTYIGFSNIYTIIIQVILGGVVYLGLSFVLKKELVNYFINLIRNVRK